MNQVIIKLNLLMHLEGFVREVQVRLKTDNSVVIDNSSVTDN